MGENSKIAWTDNTFNGWIGCSKVSPGCDNCYAEAYAKRYEIAQWGHGNPRKLTSDSNWKLPLKWNRRAEKLGVRHKVFCSSLADVFDGGVPDSWRERLWDLIEQTEHLDWLLLTKRIGNAAKQLPPIWLAYPPAHVWIGATIVNQKEADRDIPKLLEIPAAVHFLSMEPLLESVHLELPWIQDLDGFITKTSGIDWVIVGGESGPNARPMNPTWVRNLRDECRGAGVPFLFKQWGEWAPGSNFPEYIPSGEYCYFGENKGAPEDHAVWRVGKIKAGRELDGRVWDEFPIIGGANG